MAAKSFVPNPGSGFLFRNRFKFGPKSPNAVGTMTLPDGTVWKVAAWTGTTKAGDKYQSFRFSPIEAGVAPPSGERASVARPSRKLTIAEVEERAKADAVLDQLEEEDRVANIVRSHSDAMGAIPTRDMRVASRGTDTRADAAREAQRDERQESCVLCNGLIADSEESGWWSEELAHERCIAAQCTIADAPVTATVAKVRRRRAKK
jgi:hypothetical protein